MGFEQTPAVYPRDRLQTASTECSRRAGGESEGKRWIWRRKMVNWFASALRSRIVLILPFPIGLLRTLADLQHRRNSGCIWTSPLRAFKVASLPYWQMLFCSFPNVTQMSIMCEKKLPLDRSITPGNVQNPNYQNKKTGHGNTISKNLLNNTKTF